MVVNGLNKIELAPRPPLASEVAKRLLDYLFSGQVLPGDRIPSERQLAETLGVNRPAVREALRSLAFLGLLEIRQSSGTYFRGPDQDLLFTIFELNVMFAERGLSELIEARSELEILIAGLAAERRTDGQMTALSTSLEALRDANGSEFVEADIAFHTALADAAHNTVLRDMLRGIKTMVRKWVGANIQSAGTTSIAFADHLPIFDAVRDRDVVGARLAMANHMSGARMRLSKSIDLSGSSAVTLARAMTLD